MPQSSADLQFAPGRASVASIKWSRNQHRLSIGMVRKPAWLPDGVAVVDQLVVPSPLTFDCVGYTELRTCLVPGDPTAFSSSLTDHHGRAGRCPRHRPGDQGRGVPSVYGTLADAPVVVTGVEFDGDQRCVRVRTVE